MIEEPTLQELWGHWDSCLGILGCQSDFE